MIDVVSIDELLGGKPTTLIKMDIEGAEYEAIEGARHTIKMHKPRLAICVYHKVTDFIHIPFLIHQINPEYKLYLRHYTLGASETIMYAV